MRLAKKVALIQAMMVAMIGFGLLTIYAIHETDQKSIQQLESENRYLKGENTALGVTVDSLTKQVNELRDQNAELMQRAESMQVSRGFSDRTFTAEATAYIGGGCTADGTDLNGHSLESARVIAVDPSVIPIGSEVYIEFSDPEWQHYNGVFRAADTGGAINGNRIDIYFGDGGNAYSEAMQFGRRSVTVTMR